MILIKYKKVKKKISGTCVLNKKCLLGKKNAKVLTHELGPVYPIVVIILFQIPYLENKILGIKLPGAIPKIELLNCD